MVDGPALDAGAFSSWLHDMQAALRGEGDADVPCGACTACCTSSQFVHIGPDEVDCLAHVPDELVFPAPGLPRGHVVMGYDEHGHCPMLVGGRCSIYEHRPRTCRTYDCRIFPATGVELDEAGKAGIVDQARRWRFSHPTEADRVHQQALRAAVVHVRARTGAGDSSPTALAVRAVEVHERFLGEDEKGRPVLVDPDP